MSIFNRKDNAFFNEDKELPLIKAVAEYSGILAKDYEELSFAVNRLSEQADYHLEILDVPGAVACMSVSALRARAFGANRAFYERWFSDKNHAFSKLCEAGKMVETLDALSKGIGLALWAGFGDMEFVMRDSKDKLGDIIGYVPFVAMSSGKYMAKKMQAFVEGLPDNLTSPPDMDKEVENIFGPLKSTAISAYLDMINEIRAGSSDEKVMDMIGKMTGVMSISDSASLVMSVVASVIAGCASGYLEVDVVENFWNKVKSDVRTGAEFASMQEYYRGEIEEYLKGIKTTYYDNIQEKFKSVNAKKINPDIKGDKE